MLKIITVLSYTSVYSPVLNVSHISVITKYVVVSSNVGPYVLLNVRLKKN